MIRPVVNECWACFHIWEDLPGMWARKSKDGCPGCGALYWTATPKEDGP